MALPVTISGVQFPDNNYYCGPFLSGGNFYVVLLDGTDETIIEVHKATDPTSSFSEQDSAGKPDTTINIDSLWAFQDGTDLHIAHQERHATGPRVAYSVFHMSTDLWDGTIVNQEVVVPTTGVSVEWSCSIALRSDGDVIVLYAGDTDKEHGTDQFRVDYAREEGAGWTVGIAVDDAGAQGWNCGAVVLGSSDRVHFFFHLDVGSAFDHYQRTLVHTGNALETIPSGVSASGTGFGPGVSYDDGGTQRVRCSLRLTSTARAGFAEIDSVDAPGAITITRAGDRVVQVINNTVVTCPAVDGTNEHMLYSDTSGDLWHAKNGGVASVEILDAITLNRISCNIYDRDGMKLAYVYDDAGTVKYGEVDLDPALTALSGAEFPLRNYYVGPFTG